MPSFSEIGAIIRFSFPAVSFSNKKDEPKSVENNHIAEPLLTDEKQEESVVLTLPV
jgi:hypothetical protein